MKILLFGISNIGKTSIGKLLAQKLKYNFFDLDDEIKAVYHTTLENFNRLFPDDYKRHQIRCDMLKQLIDRSKHSVIAVSVINYKEMLDPILNNKDILTIELRDKPENIFDRLVFSDENDNIYKDDDYKNKHRKHYMNEIISDLYYYSQIYQNVSSKYFIDNKPIAAAANELYTLIQTKQPITIKFKLDEIRDDIFQSWEESVCHYNIITHEKIYQNRKEIDWEIEEELAVNHMIYVELPIMTDYDEYDTLLKFIDTVNDEKTKEKLLEAYDDLDRDYNETIEKLLLEDKWDDFNYRHQLEFVKNWCYENDIEFE